MTTPSLSERFHDYRVSRLVVLVLAVLGFGGLALTYAYRHSPGLLQGVNAKKNSTRTPAPVAAPALTIQTHVSFEYEQWTQMLSRVPTAPNTWHVESKLTNSNVTPVEILPLYLYSEAYPTKPTTWQNASTACPKSYTHAFSANAQRGLTIAPQDLSGERHETIFLPMVQLDQPPDLSHGITFGGMMSTRTYPTALIVDTKAVSWARFTLAASSTVEVTWEFQSIWAVSRKTRLEPTFEMVQLGPIVRTGSATKSKAYLVVVKLNSDPDAKEIASRQSSFQLQELTATLPQQLSQAFPNNRSSVEEFANAALASEP